MDFVRWLKIVLRHIEDILEWPHGIVDCITVQPERLKIKCNLDPIIYSRYDVIQLSKNDLRLQQLTAV